jgi:hypothetical protein
MKTSIVTTNFTGGELDPALQGRTDLEKFSSSAKLLSNFAILKQGGITGRPPTVYKGSVKTPSQTSRLIPFIYSSTTAYILEFGNQYIRVWKNGAYTGFEVATPYLESQITELKYTQSADTMIFFHPLWLPQRLLRFGDTNWTFGDAPMNPLPIGESGLASASITLTLTALTGAITITTGGFPFFLQSDVGRTITVDGSSATIATWVASGTVLATVTTPFTSLTHAPLTWKMNGTPLTAVTPSVSGPVGAAVTLTLALAGWRTEDVGKFVELNGGLVKITGYTSTTVVTGLIETELAGVVAAPSDSWTLKGAIWNAVDGCPACGTFHQQRLWAASTRTYPQTLWGSKLGLPFDFSPGVLDDSAIYKTISSSEVNPIVHLVSAQELLILGYAQEFSGRGGVEKGITTSNMQLSIQSNWSTTSAVRPLQIGEEVISVERSGTVMRAYSSKQVDGFTSAPISFFSEHLLASGVKSMSYEQRPNAIIWIATTDGKLHALTYNVFSNLICFASGSTDGFVESVATIPDGALEKTYCLVRRTINGVTARYVEALDWSVIYGRHDSLITLTAGSPQAVWTGLGHLQGKTVRVHADDVFMGELTVASGQITLPRSASKVAVGLAFDSTAVLQNPIMETREGNSQGGSVSIHKVRAKLLNTVGLNVNGEDISFRTFGASKLDSAIDPFTGVKDITGFGWASATDDTEDNEGATTTISSTQGNPCTILSIIRNLSMNAG